MRADMHNRPVADKLRKARALVARGWTQKAFARSKTGREVSEYGKSAVCWCAYAAIEVVRGQADAANVLRKAANTEFIIGWNDAPERTQAEVLAAFDKAIALAEKSA
jgi:hypothetical protein